MQDKLHKAAAEGRLDLIKQYSKEPGFNVNCLHSEHGTHAIDWAAQAGKLDVLKYLIETLKADITDLPNQKSLLKWALSNQQGTRNKEQVLEVCRYILANNPSNKASDLFEVYILTGKLEDLNRVEEAIKQKQGLDDPLNYGQTILQTAFIKRHGSWENHLSLQSKFFKLLLQNGADIHANNFIYSAKNETGYPEIRNLFAETIIRADLKACLLLLPVLNKEPTLEEIVDQLGNRKLRNSSLLKVKAMLQKLEQEHHFNSNLTNKILKTLESKMDTSIDPEDYPQCLRKFVAKNEPIQITLEDLVLQLQHARGIIPSPYNKQQLQMQQDVDHVHALQNFLNFPEHYTVDNLKEFVNPKNHAKSLLEMRLYPDIIDWICIAALHPQLNEVEKSCCILVLKHMENPTELEEAILGVGEVSYNSAQTIANGVGELKTEVVELKTEVGSLKTTVSELSTQLKKTDEKIDLLLSLISNLKSEHGEKRKFEMDLDPPKSNFFSKS